MNPKRKFKLFFGFLCAGMISLALASAARVYAKDAAPAVGSVAPDFTLDSQEGKPISLHQWRGRWVVLYFYPKDFTRGCTIEAHNFEQDLAQYQKKKAVILGVSVQSASSHKDFCAKEGLNFKLLADTDHKVSTTYGSLMSFGLFTLSSRHTFLIDPKGVIRKEFLKVDPARHSQEILAALTKLERP